MGKRTQSGRCGNKMSFLSKYAKFIFEKKWTQEDHDAVLSLINKKNGCKLIDLGCGDGRLTAMFAEKANASTIVGVEPAKIKNRIKNKKIKIVSADLNKKLPFKDGSFDIVVSHFSIEHLYNVDVFIKEMFRILKKGGYVIVATDNLASWPNILSLILGWQPFSTAYGVATRPMGNPLAGAGDFVIEEGDSLGELSHNKVQAYQSLKEVFKFYGFKLKSIVGVGYFPFFGALSNFFCSIDPRHAHLIIVKAVKK